MTGSVLAPLRAGLFTRLVYSLALLAFLPSALAGSSGWIALALGGGMAANIGLTALLTLAALAFFRAYQVLRYPAALDARMPNAFGKFLRYAGWLAMFGGAAGGVGLFAVKPITLMLFKTAGDAGIGYFVVGLALVVLANLGWLGCLVFELSRVCGPRLPPEAAVKPWSKRRQDFAVLGVLVATAIGALHYLTDAVEKPCGETNLARCVSTTEGGVRRMIGLPNGESIALETTVEEIEMRRRASDRTWSLKESPAVSLKTAGYPVATSPEARVRVRLDASPASEAVVVTLVVLDGAEETARFVTRFNKSAAIEKSPSGGIRVVVDLPANAQPGSRSMHGEAAGRRGYALDQIFIQLRSAIGTEIEAREWPARIVRPATLADSLESPRGASAKAIITQDTVDSGCEGKLARARTAAIAFEGELGWPLHGATFTATGTVGPHVIFSHRDRVVCRGSEVWIVSYGVRRPELRMRRYAHDGRLLRFVDTRIPPAELGQFGSDVIDPHSVREENGRIRFERVVIRFAGDKIHEKKREFFEVVP